MIYGLSINTCTSFKLSQNLSYKGQEPSYERILAHKRVKKIMSVGFVERHVVTVVYF